MGLGAGGLLASRLSSLHCFRVLACRAAAFAADVCQVSGDFHSLDAAVDINMSMGQVIAHLRRNKKAVLICLGDYGDRGTGAHNTLLMVLGLKAMFPTQVILLRGNHEVSWMMAGENCGRAVLQLEPYGSLLGW